MQSLLGIDLGTSGLKAGIFDLDGTLLGLGRATNPYLVGPPGWAEQDPEAWWSGCCDAVGGALAQAGSRAGDIAALGVCGFHHCPVFLDSGGVPVRPAVVTHDSRLGASLDDLRQSGILEEVIRISGSKVLTGHFPPIYHLVRNQDREAMDQARWILLAKDYLRYRLTGEIGTEICDATGTNLIAMPQQDWSDRLCRLLQVPRHKLPPIGAPTHIAGQVTRDAAEATGLEQGTPVVFGGGDSHCALVGLGAVRSGEVGLLLGSNSTLRASFDVLLRPLEQMVWIQQHVVPGHFTVAASSMAGSSVLSWFRGVCLDHACGDTSPYHELDALASRVPPGCEGLLFHPYLFGERSPFCSPEARGAFLGIRHWHNKEHMLRGIMEGVALAIANCLDAIQAVAHEAEQPLTGLRTGASGGSRLTTWRQIISSALDRVVEIVDVDEPGCLGVALLAGVGAGLYSDIPAAVQRAVRITDRTVPDPESAALYRELRTAFNETYRALEACFYRRTA